MKKVLYITNRLNSKNKNGAYICAKRNYEILKQKFNNELDCYLISSKTIIKKIINIFIFNRLDEITIADEKMILKKIEENNYEYLFFDGSNFGYCIKKVKQKFPKIKVITYCHDITYQLYNSLYSNSNKLLKFKYKKLMNNALINEKISFEKSDIIITLNKKDSKLLNKIYKKKSDIEIEMSIYNPLKNMKEKDMEIQNEKFKLLFVGVGTFLPNILGINFFIKDVLENIEVELIIVGKGTEKNKEYWEKLNSKVTVVGTVDNLKEYYDSVDAVIAPIFIGGGMKVKIVEALSYGKTIFGTKEAFEGYDLPFEKIGGICNNADEFALKINDYIKWWKENNRPKFNKESYDIFEEKYSYEASLEKFEQVFL